MHGPVVVRPASRVRLWMVAALLGAILGVTLGRPEPVASCGGCGDIAFRFVGAFTDDDGIIHNPSLDPKDNGVDPGYDKGVAGCRAWVASSGIVNVEITNGYPRYTCRFWTKVRNTGDTTITYTGSALSAPAELTVRDVTGSSCGKITPGEQKFLSFTVHIEQAARQQAVYTFHVRPSFKGSACGW